MSVYLERQGQGPNLVLLHGWGMNSAVLYNLAAALADDFCVHLIDLPGFGDSQALPANASLADWTDAVLRVAPTQAAWLGWSLGGLVATQAALQAPLRVTHLLTLASSPCFVAQENWPGIKPAVLAAFAEQLSVDHQAVINRFLALQAMGSEHAREDIRQLRLSLANKPSPAPSALSNGLSLLATVDLRDQLVHLCVPVLRLYGRLDGLVPYQVVPLVAALLPDNNRQHYVESKASHAPFISHLAHTVAQIKDFLAPLASLEHDL